MLDRLLKKHPSFLYAQEISDICKPLEKLDVNYFAHVRINEDKKFSALSANPRFTEHYLTHKYYLADIHTVNEKMFGDYFVWDNAEFTSKSVDMCKTAGEFGIHNPLTIIHKNQNSVDYYHFASNMQDKKINGMYIANMDLLNLFIQHFRENIDQSKSFQKAYHLTFEIPSMKDPQTANFENYSVISNRDDFINSLQINPKAERLLIGNTHLSKRQSEILRYVVMGKTFKQISKITGLSPRTIGHYFEAVKHKLDVSSREEVITKIMDWDLIRLF